MPLDPSITVFERVEFCARKADQFDRMGKAVAGLSMAQSGEFGTQFVMGKMIADGVHEAVIIGQLPHRVIERFGSTRNPVIREAPNERKPIERRRIDLSDGEIAAVLGAWARGETALGLPGVPALYRNGQMSP